MKISSIAPFIITKEIINDLRGLELPGMQKCENFELDFSLGAHL